MSDTTPETPKIKGWNHVPNVPIQTSPFFSWPPDPARMWRWLARQWLTFTENLLILAIALITYTFFQPSLETMATLHWQWIGAIWLRNIVLMSMVAGGLHWYFYMRRGQAERLKYDPRDLMHKGKQFTFGGQVRDNMFWTLASGVTVWTAYEVAMFHAMANGWAPVLLPSEHPVWFVLMFLLTPVWLSFHFYWIHRILHWGPLYKLAHALHHRNINVGPWSGMSMHPVEHIGFLSPVLICFVVPAHPLHVLFMMQHLALRASSSHTGYEKLVMGDTAELALGTFHHQMHHRYFEVNYGNLEMPWDKFFGTFHDGTVAAHERLKDRRGRRG
ncbi:MAG: sterol desaturase family protein [Roseovarius sp.]